MDGVLDTITPEQFNEWIAYRQLESDPFERLLACIKLIGLYVVTALGGKDVKLEDLDPLRPDEERYDKASPKQWQALIRARAGGGDGHGSR